MSKALLSCVVLASLFITISLGQVSSSGNKTDDTCTYCVANPKASGELIQKKLDFCCMYIPESCDLIQPGERCFVPNDLRTTASYVFNDYFLGGAECDFDGAEIHTKSDPSHGDCKFECRNA